MARSREDVRTRKDNFYTYYSAHKDKLNGKTLDEAYAAMKRNAANRGGARPESDRAPVNDAIARRTSKSDKITVGSGLGKVNLPKPHAPRGFGGMKVHGPSMPSMPSMPRGFGGMKYKNPLPTLSKQDQQDALDSTNNAVARRIKKMKRSFMP